MKNKLILSGAGHDVHVWEAGLDLPEPDIRRAEALLCEDEKKRADRLIYPEHRRRFIAAHAVLRLILGRYLGLDPEKIEITSDEHGKPCLASHVHCPPLCFNLSHSGSLAIIGVSAGRAIGVDIECVRPVSGMEGISRRFFAKPEARLVESAEEDVRTALFFRLWTMKEACLKACGLGLRGLEGLPSVTPETDAGTSPALVPDAACLEISGRSWSVKRIFTSPGYEAAVALEGDAPWEIKCRRIEAVF
ncbi:MAG: 4'-phosphopantetheinyl transferase superfamily protein [Deltaproteobacteria bacterium]|nr:4'-phosphopantetheinyl transferase superfamily protein [Deltaproteobacteria bacterium]